MANNSEARLNEEEVLCCTLEIVVERSFVGQVPTCDIIRNSSRLTVVAV